MCPNLDPNAVLVCATLGGIVIAFMIFLLILTKMER